MHGRSSEALPGNRRNRRGVAVIITALMLVFAIPLIGLAVDGGILYAVRIKLSMACDAAALAGARALSRGLDGATQQSNATAVAQEYVNLNLPSGYFGATLTATPTVAIDTSVSNQRSVTVTAGVSV